MAALGLGRETVVRSWELHDGDRPRLEVWIRVKARRRGRCGRCGELASFYDQGGGQRRWRHIDVGFAVCCLVADAPRVDCGDCGPTVAAVPWARHDSSFTRAFDDLVVHDAIVGNEQAAADRYGISWRAVNNACVRVATEALGRVDLLDGLVAIAIDEVKYKKGHRYLTVVCDHFTGRVIWAAKGRSTATVGEFFDALGPAAGRRVAVRDLRRRRMDPDRGRRAGCRGDRVHGHVPCDRVGVRMQGPVGNALSLEGQPVMLARYSLRTRADWPAAGS